MNMPIGKQKVNWVARVGLLGGSLLFLPACSGVPTHMLYDSVGVAGGAGLAAALTKGNPIATVGGAVGGLAVSEMMQTASKNNGIEKYDAGYDRGRSDDIKEVYWAKERLLKPNPSTGGAPDVSYLPVPVEDAPDSPIKHVPNTVSIPVINQ